MTILFSGNNVPEHHTNIPKDKEVQNNEIKKAQQAKKKIWDATNIIDRSKKKPAENINEEEKEVMHNSETWTVQQQETTNIHTKKEDDIFVIIDTYDPNVDPKMYSDWKALSSWERIIVKWIYEQLTHTQDQQQQLNIVNEISDLRILRWLRDVLIKKIIVMEKKKKNNQQVQTISKMTVRREYQIIEQSIINTQNMIMKYTIQPSDFSLVKISGLDNANNIPNGGIQVNFMLVKNNENIGVIGFTNKWNLITQTLKYMGNSYTISQNETSINITENQLIDE